MADKHIADGESGFKAVSSAPDVCVVGGSAVPFDSFQDLSKQKSYVPSVKARGEHILTVGSVIAGTQGNAGSGVVSLTGAAVLGAVGVVLVYVIQTLLQPLI